MWYTLAVAKPTQGGALTERAGSEAQARNGLKSSMPRPRPSSRRGGKSVSKGAKALAMLAALPTSRVREEEPTTPSELVPLGRATLLGGFISFDAPGVLQAICDDIASGRPVRHAVEKYGVNYETFRSATYRRADVAASVAQARAHGSEVWIKELETAAKEGRSVHAPAWMLAKLAPKIFGEKLVEEDAKNEAPIVEASVTDPAAEPEQEVSNEDAMIMAKALLAHRQKKQAEADAAEKKGDGDGLV